MLQVILTGDKKMPIIKINTTLILGFFILLISQQSHSAFFVVDRFEDAPDSGINGTCAGVNMVGDVCSLRAAIMEANASVGADTILVPQGSEFVLNVLGENEDNAASGDLDIYGEITIINGIDGFVINGNGTDRIFHFHDGGKLTLENGTLKNGAANTALTFEGGAVKVEDNGIFITDDVKFVDNLANRGGAVFNDGDVLLENSYLHHNAITDENTPINLTARGDAILNRHVMWLLSTTVAHNGTLFTNSGNAPLLNGTYAIHANPNGNAAPQPTTLIYNSTVAQNKYSGIYSDQGITVIDKSTIANHPGRGLRFFRDPDHAGEVQLQIKYSLFANNIASNCNDLQFLPANEVDIIGNFNASTDGNCGFSGMDNLENIDNPLNGSLADWGGFTPTLMILPDSPIVDFVNANCGSEDQRGGVRPLDGSNGGLLLCDVGSVELDRTTDPLVNDVIFANGFEAMF